MAERCTCGCCHVPDHGACDTFERGMNGRCVYCDHGQGCHPGTGKHFNLPLATGEREEPWMELQDLAHFQALLDCACYGHQWIPVKIGDDLVCRRCGYRRSEVDDNGVPKIKHCSK